MRIFVLCLLALIVSDRAALAEEEHPPKPPNIVLIISDDQAWGDFGFMGHEHIKTPNLDRLASQSLTFKRGYVPSSLCCPSLASLITGQYAHQHKVTSNDPPLPAGAGRDHPDFKAGRERMNQFMDAAPALPRLLRERGYWSFQAGKWWQGDFKRGGFTHGMTKGLRHGDDGLTIGRETMQPVFDFMDEANGHGKPFMVWYAPMMPHNPHNPPKRLLEKYEGMTESKQVAKYWAMVEWFDETCGALLNRLDEMKIADDTIVIYVTDNGWIQNPDKGEYAPRSKQSPNEGGIRTPIIVRWPKHVKPEMSESLASSLDITPTLLKAAGVAPDPSMPGIDLLDAGAVKSRKALFGEIFHHSAVDLDKPVASLQYRWVIDGQWKLIVPRKELEPEAKTELYDLSADPHENTDLASKEPARVEAMTKQLDAWWTPQ